MRRILSFSVSALLALTLFISCEESASVADMRITLNSDVSRLIAPEEVPLEVTLYQIRGTGPNNGSFSFTTTKTSTTLSGVAVGNWHIEATGLNEENVPLVTGSTDFTLSASNPSVVVRLATLVGNGNLSISMSWNKDVITDPRIELEITKQNEEESESLTASMNTSEGTATASRTNMEAGSYILQGRLYSSDILMSGFTEAVRIVGDETSSADIEFNLDNFPYAPGSIQLLDQSGIPVECTVEGVDSEVTAGEEITVSLVPEKANLNDITVMWYIDGVQVATGTSAGITFTPGAHRLDAVAYTSKIGSYGSCSISLNALVRTAKGIPGNSVRLDAETTGLSLGTNTLIKFLPDGKFMVISGLNRTLQIATMARNNVDVLKEYTTSSLSGLNGTPVDLGYRLLDASGTYAVVVGMNSPANTVRFNYRSETNEVEQIETCGGLLTSYMGATEKYGMTGGSAGFDKLMNEIVMLAYDSNGKNTYVLERYVPGLSSDEDYAYRGIDITMDLENALSQSDGYFASMNSLGISPDGTYYVVGNENGHVAIMNHKQYSGIAQKNDYALPTITDDYAGLRKIMVSENGITYFMGSDFIAGFDVPNDSKVFFTEKTGKNFLDFTINEETGNLYVLSDEMIIYCYEIENDGSLGNETAVETLSSNENLELSTDGSYLILYTKTAATQIEVMRIKTTA